MLAHVLLEETRALKILLLLLMLLRLLISIRKALYLLVQFVAIIIIYSQNVVISIILPLPDLL